MSKIQQICDEKVRRLHTDGEKEQITEYLRDF